MTLRVGTTSIAAGLAAAITACGGSTTASSAAGAASPTTTAAPSATSETSSTASGSTGVAATGGSPVVLARSVGTQGTVLVAAANGMTVYTFSQDVAGSGVSKCSGACLTRWPAVTVPAGTAPAGGPGISGSLGTITRSDNGAAQVTYNGLPLYFFSNDRAPGDANGVYPNWAVVHP